LLVFVFFFLVVFCFFVVCGWGFFCVVFFGVVFWCVLFFWLLFLVFFVLVVFSVFKLLIDFFFFMCVFFFCFFICLFGLVFFLFYFVVFLCFFLFLLFFGVFFCGMFFLFLGCVFVLFFLFYCFVLFSGCFGLFFFGVCCCSLGGGVGGGGGGVSLGGCVVCFGLWVVGGFRVFLGVGLSLCVFGFDLALLVSGLGFCVWGGGWGGGRGGGCGVVCVVRASSGRLTLDPCSLPPSSRPRPLAGSLLGPFPDWCAPRSPSMSLRACGLAEFTSIATSASVGRSLWAPPAGRRKPARDCGGSPSGSRSGAGKKAATSSGSA